MIVRNINLTISELKDLLEKWLKSVNGKMEFFPKSNNLFQAVITIPGQEQALINIYQTKKGLTLDSTVGKNPELSEKIIQTLISGTGVEQVKPSTRVLKGIHGDLLTEFLNTLSELEAEVTEQKEMKNFKQFKLKNYYNHELNLNYYPSTATIVIQGYSTKLFKDVVLWFLDKTIESPEEIVKIIFESIEDFKKLQIEFPDQVIDEALKNMIGEHYKDNNFLKDTERKWLKVSYFLLNVVRDLPDYYPSISASLKVIEGVLRRILINRYGLEPFDPKSKNIKAFDFVTQEQRWKLKPRYESKFQEEQIILVEDLYAFLKEIRNRFTHNLGVPEPSALSNIEEAQEIFNKIIELLQRLKIVFPKGI